MVLRIFIFGNNFYFFLSNVFLSSVVKSKSGGGYQNAETKFSMNLIVNDILNINPGVQLSPTLHPG